MHHNKVRLFDRFVQELRDRPQNERVADSVKSVFAQTIRLGDILIDRVCAHGFRDGLMEGRVEKGNALDFGKLAFAVTNYFQS